MHLSKYERKMLWVMYGSSLQGVVVLLLPSVVARAVPGMLHIILYITGQKNIG